MSPEVSFELPIKIEEILKILPHRYPFVLVDRIIQLDTVSDMTKLSGRKCVGIKNVTMNEHFFAGHFPHKPIMPGVLILEAMAQTAAICGYRPPRPGMPMDVLIASIDNARFRKPVVPGDQLVITVEILRDRGSMFTFRCVAKVDDQVVAEADMLAASFPKKD
jgi:3-hydroxyacyl-[acyl-carrier-protein] dehydratase